MIPPFGVGMTSDDKGSLTRDLGSGSYVDRGSKPKYNFTSTLPRSKLHSVLHDSAWDPVQQCNICKTTLNPNGDLDPVNAVSACVESPSNDICKYICNITNIYTLNIKSLSKYELHILSLKGNVVFYHFFLVSIACRSLAAENVLLRGCRLKNTPYVFGKLFKKINYTPLVT